MPSGCRALSEPRPLSGPQCPCLWSGPDRADRTGRLWADRGGRVFIPSRPSGNEEGGTRVPAPTHWLVQPLGTGVRGAHHLPGEDSDERTREGPSAPLTPRGDRGPQQASRNVWWKQGVEGSRGEGCQRGQQGWASGTWLWGGGAGPQAPGSGEVLGLRRLALTWSLFLQNVAACFLLLLSERLRSWNERAEGNA